MDFQLSNDLLNNLIDICKEPAQHSPVIIRPGVQEDIRPDNSIKDIQKFSGNDKEHENFEKDPRINIQEYSWNLMEEQSLFRCHRYGVIRLKLPQEDSKTFDINLNADKLVFFSHRYKLIFHLPHRINSTPVSCQWIQDIDVLEIKVELA